MNTSIPISKESQKFAFSGGVTFSTLTKSFCFVWVVALRHSQQFFSHDGTFSWVDPVQSNEDEVHNTAPQGARWPSGRASHSGARGRGFETYLHRVVSLSKIRLLPEKYW